MEQQFAAIVPVDSTPIGVWRGVQLVSSLFSWEPRIGWLVALEDSLSPLGLTELSCIPTTCKTTVVSNPLESPGPLWIGRLTAGILTAFDWIANNTTADFVLRVDSDALTIGPFARGVRQCMINNPQAGVIGVIGASCNPDHRSHWYRTSPRVPQLIRAFHAWPSLQRRENVETIRSAGGVQFPRGFISYDQLRAFDLVRSHIARAMANGFERNEDCQGGACVITREMIDRMASESYLATSNTWAMLPFPDDQVLAMYAYAVGLGIVDCSRPGEPFGVQGLGLAYPPGELLARGYGLIHSVRNDSRYSEAFIRRYFREREKKNCSVRP